jgi:hypothetical protein
VRNGYCTSLLSGFVSRSIATAAGEIFKALLASYCVLSGHGVVAYEDGQQIDLLPGKAFHITTTPHDSCVVGDQPYVSLHVLKLV